jgi:threonine synthase
MTALRCTSTGTLYPSSQARWQGDSGSLLDLDFEPAFDLDAIRQRPPSLWRYREAIPIEDSRNIVSLGEGFTPLLPLIIDGRSVYIKHDHLFPTGSFKDRGASVMVSKVKELGIRDVVQDSSGNAGCSVAAYCAQASIECSIFVPEETEPAKVAQIRMYGAHVKPIGGGREKTAQAALSAARNSYYASHVWNPWFHHGTKTLTFEICEQLGWRAPDAIVVPVGNGTLVLGAYIGFTELLRAGVIRAMPHIIGVQSAECAPLVEAFRLNADQPAGSSGGRTIAEGIAIAAPLRGTQILEAVRQTQGRMISVQEEEIIETLQLICGMGHYIEPTAAAGIAGLRSYLRTAPRDELVVSVFTGHGLKSSAKMLSLLSHH